MKNYWISKILFAAFLAALFLYPNGCAPATYHVIMIPSNHQSLAAFRECQRTYVAATGYEDYEKNNLIVSCLRSIPNEREENQEQSKLKFPPGCRHLFNAYPSIILQCR
ncbi:MAG: hypothetical protein PHE84_10430 [bacterium]|nr:hypothetical protein [bacterium]